MSIKPNLWCIFLQDGIILGLIHFNSLIQFLGDAHPWTPVKARSHKRVCQDSNLRHWHVHKNKLITFFSPVWWCWKYKWKRCSLCWQSGQTFIVLLRCGGVVSKNIVYTRRLIIVVPQFPFLVQVLFRLFFSFFTVNQIFRQLTCYKRRLKNHSIMYIFPIPQASVYLLITTKEMFNLCESKAHDHQIANNYYFYDKILQFTNVTFTFLTVKIY